MQIATSVIVVAHDSSSGVGRDGADAGAADPGSDDAAFGDVLSRRIRADGSQNVPPTTDRRTGGGVAEHVAPDAMPTKWAPADFAGFQTAGAASAAADDDSTPTSDDATDGANTDLAAQLAFVAQWAALGQPADRPNGPADATASDTKPDPIAVDRGSDLRAKGDAVRDDRQPAFSTVAALAPSAAAAAQEQAIDPADTRVAALQVRSNDVADRPANAADPQLPLFADFVRGAVLREERSSPTASPTDSDPTRTTLAAATAHSQPELRDAVTGAPLPADLNPGAAGIANVALFASQTTIASLGGHAAQVASLVAPAGSLADGLHEPVGTTAWSHEVGQAALRIAATDLQGASLRLNPEHLGPLDVQVRIDQGVAHVAFHAAHADTRQALESSRATLDQLFQGQGLRTGDVSIASSTDGSNAARTNPEGSSADASRRDGSTARREAADARGDALVANVSVRTRKALGLVDTFA